MNVHRNITGRPAGARAGIHACACTQTRVSRPDVHMPRFPGAVVALQRGPRGDGRWSEERCIRPLDQGAAAPASQGDMNVQWSLVRVRWRRTGLSRRGSRRGRTEQPTRDRRLPGGSVFMRRWAQDRLPVCWASFPSLNLVKLIIMHVSKARAQTGTKTKTEHFNGEGFSIKIRKINMKPITLELNRSLV